jgi:hypothetical protein
VGGYYDTTTPDAPCFQILHKLLNVNLTIYIYNTNA